MVWTGQVALLPFLFSPQTSDGQLQAHSRTWPQGRYFWGISRPRLCPTTHHPRLLMSSSMLASAPHPGSLLSYQPVLPGAASLQPQPVPSPCLESQLGVAHPRVIPCQGHSSEEFIKEKRKVLPLGRDNARPSHVSGCPAGEQPEKSNHAALKDTFSSHSSRSSLGAGIFSALLREGLSVPDGCQAAEDFLYV